MEKLFKSKVAFIAFVILFTLFLAFFYKDSVSIALFSGSIGGLIGFVFAQWYWVEKMKDIQDKLDARMETPEQAELLKRKEDQLKEMSDSNMKLVKCILVLQQSKHSFQNLLNEIRVFSNSTFGRERERIPAILNHLKKEVTELENAYKDYLPHQDYYGTDGYDIAVESIHDEFSDCFILLFDAASKWGLCADQILELSSKKLEINKNRKWGQPDENGVVEHLREDKQ